MNSKHKKTLAAIFAKPEPKSLPYRDVESLLRALDCRIKERDGSRVAFLKGDAKMSMHRPHPGKEIKGYQIKDIREFLVNIDVQP